MRRMLRVISVLALGSVSAWAQGDATGALVSDKWSQLVTANDLGIEGKMPFHLGMTFQLYGLDGKPTLAGSVETWWRGTQSGRTVVHLAGLNEEGAAPDGADAALVRDAYLVSELLNSEVQPLRKQMNPVELVSKPVSIGKLQLECIGPARERDEDMNAKVSVACVGQNSTEAVVLQGLGGKMTLIRSRVAKFRDTYTGLEIRLAYLGKDAITGKVTTLQAEETAKVEADTPAAPADPIASTDHRGVHLAGGVIAGYRVKFVEPDYPLQAKIEHLRGSVLLKAIIGVDGIVRRLVPIASTDPMFTDAAIAAVKKWKYAPYLLNGTPTEVDTTITMNFAINGG